MRRILVTGATGFIGSHVTRALVRRGHEVTVVLRSSSNCKRLLDIQTDLRAVDRDTLLANGLLKACGKQDVVVHLATLYGRGDEAAWSIVDTNLAYPLRLLELAIQEKVSLFLSTDSYSTKPSGLYSHLESYGLSKKQFLDWSRLLLSGAALAFANMRLEHPYGPDDAPDKFTRSTIRSCLQGIPRLSLTAGTQKRDFVYVGDVAEAYATIVDTSSRRGWVEYEVGTGTSLSVRQWVETVHAMTSSKTALGFGDLPLRRDEIMNSAADLTLLQELGWKPRTSLAQGLADTIEWERSLIAAQPA